MVYLKILIQLLLQDFTDRNRGAVLRLSRDGITPISNNGMKDYFFDNFSAINSNHGLIGTFDDKKDTYNLTFYGYTDTLGNANPTISFSESVKSKSVLIFSNPSIFTSSRLMFISVI